MSAADWGRERGCVRLFTKAALMASDSLITQISSPTTSSRGRCRRAALLHVDRIGHPVPAEAAAVVVAVIVAAAVSVTQASIQ